MAKSGVSILKLAHKSKRIPAWLGTYLTKQTKTIRATKDISTLKPLFKELETMHTHVGINQTLILLSKTKDFHSLQRMAQLTKRYKHESKTLLKLSDKRVLDKAQLLKNHDIKSIKLASTYGTNGFTQLFKGGEKHFLKTTQRLKAYSKVGYKGEIWKIFLWLMKHLTDSMLMWIMALSSLLLTPWRRLVHKPKP